MLECCILFLHHRDDPTTRAHLELLRRLNPYPVVAVCNGAAEHVAGALDVARSSERWRNEDPWAGTDTVLYRWFLQGGLRAERYLFIGWDTMATMSVREFFAEVWDADAAGSVVKRIEEDPDWIWFFQRDRLPEPLRRHAAGTGRSETVDARGDRTAPCRLFQGHPEFIAQGRELRSEPPVRDH